VSKEIDPDRPCPHEDFLANVGVARLTDVEDGPVTGYMAEIRVWCADCGEQFRWVGAPVGVIADSPSVSIDEAELRAPLRPASADPDLGLGIPGFANINYRDQDTP